MTRVRVQRVIMSSGVESAIVLRDGAVVEPVDRFLAHLTSIERSPNTVKAYAHDLRDFFAFLDARGLCWDGVSVEDLEPRSFDPFSGLSRQHTAKISQQEVGPLMLATTSSSRQVNSR